MDISKATSLRKEWGDKNCEHPHIVKETFSRIEDVGYIERHTGDYVCTTCGEVVAASKKEFDDLMNKKTKK